MKKYILNISYNNFLFFSFILSIVVIHIFYLSLINPISFEILAYAKENNLAPPRHYSIILKDLEQEICLILFIWSISIIYYNNINIDNLINLADTESLDHFFKIENSNKNYSVFIDNLYDTFQLELSFIRYISWAIPSIGFIGTVRGIGDALSKADEAISGNISNMTESLGIAFNSTFVALLLSILLTLVLTRVETKQDKLIIGLRQKSLSN